MSSHLKKVSGTGNGVCVCVFVCFFLFVCNVTILRYMVKLRPGALFSKVPGLHFLLLIFILILSGVE